MAAFAGQVIVLRFPIVVGETPLRFNESLAFQAPQCGIKSALFDEEGVVAVTTDETRDGIAMKRAPDEGLENEDIEGTPEKLEAGLLHAEPLPLDFMGRITCFPLLRKGKERPGRRTSPASISPPS
jgi:hypothetical protein